MTLREAYKQSRTHLESTGLLTLSERQALKAVFTYADVIEQELVAVKTQLTIQARFFAALALKSPTKSIDISELELDAMPDNLTVSMEPTEEGYVLRVKDEAPPPS